MRLLRLTNKFLAPFAQKVTLTIPILQENDNNYINNIYIDGIVEGCSLNSEKLFLMVMSYSVI